MYYKRKVVWSEGMFLRPQHFQQQERYLEHCIHQRSLASEPFFWGFRRIEIDSAALSIGKLKLEHGEGLFADGTPFGFPAISPGPEPRGFAEGAVGDIVYLALPLRRSGVQETEFEAQADSPARFGVTEEDVPDCNSVGGEPAELQTGIPRFRLLLGRELTDAWTALPVARVVECRSNKQLVLDQAFIPPILRSDGWQPFHGWMVEALGLVYQRANMLSERLSQPGRGGVSQVSEFLMLQMLNRYQPLLWHVTDSGSQHPEYLFRLLLQLVGELATFASTARRPDELPKYNHDDLYSCFTPLMLKIRESLSQVLEQTATQIELSEKKYGIHIGQVRDRSLLESASFVISAHASMTDDLLRTQFLSQVKVGPTSRIRDLVNLHLPGLKLKPLPIAPREIPYHAGYNYFEMECSGELWREITASGAFAMHIAGDFPQLEIECWAIRR